MWRHQIAYLAITNSQLSAMNDQNEKVVLIGTVVKEPDIRENNTRLVIKPKKIQNQKVVYESEKRLKGKVLVIARQYPEYQYGDELKIIGKLKTPPRFEDFNYKDYLAKDGIYSVMYKPKIELLSRGKGRDLTSTFYCKILGFKERLRKNIEQNLSPPQSSILTAIILGEKRKISKQWKNKLNITGVRHITCVSGMHIVVLSGILMWLGTTLGLWRGQAFYFAIILLFLFIIMIGAPVSAVRAGIMAGLVLLAQKLGRLSTSSRAVVFAGTIMLINNPLLLKSDIGFQLSFLAVLGIIYLMPIFQDYLNKIPNPEYFSLRDVASMTLSVQIFTLPLLIYNFGYISLVSLISNILIVPILSFVMISGFVFGLVGIFCQSLGWILSWPCWLLLTYIIKIIDFLSQVPFASFAFKISWIWLLISYLILGYITWQLTEGQKFKFLDY